MMFWNKNKNNIMQVSSSVSFACKHDLYFPIAAVHTVRHMHKIYSWNKGANTQGVNKYYATIYIHGTMGSLLMLQPSVVITVQ